MIHSYVESLGVKFKMVAQPVRVAITGVIGGPGLPEFMLAIGKVARRSPAWIAD